jgi:hypothetical protein
MRLKGAAVSQIVTLHRILHGQCRRGYVMNHVVVLRSDDSLDNTEQLID